MLRRFQVLFFAINLLTVCVAAAAELPKDKYNPKGSEVAEANFKKTLAKEKLAWVLFDDSDPAMPENIRNQRDNFWQVLKKEFGGQVNAFIRIDTRGWSENGRLARKETQSNVFPSFVLYEKGIVANEGTNYAVVLNGAPHADQIDEMLEFIRDVSPLK